MQQAHAAPLFASETRFAAVLFIECVLPLAITGDHQQHAHKRAEERKSGSTITAQLEGYEGQMQAHQQHRSAEADLNEGEAHGSALRPSHRPLHCALFVAVALSDQFGELQCCVGRISDLAGLPTRKAGLANAGAPRDLGLGESVVRAQPLQVVLCGAHEAESYAIVLRNTMRYRIVLSGIVRP